MPDFPFKDDVPLMAGEAPYHGGTAAAQAIPVPCSQQLSPRTVHAIEAGSIPCWPPQDEPCPCGPSNDTEEPERRRDEVDGTDDEFLPDGGCWDYPHGPNQNW